MKMLLENSGEKYIKSDNPGTNFYQNHDFPVKRAPRGNLDHLFGVSLTNLVPVVGEPPILHTYDTLEWHFFLTYARFAIWLLLVKYFTLEISGSHLQLFALNLSHLVRGVFQEKEQHWPISRLAPSSSVVGGMKVNCIISRCASTWLLSCQLAGCEVSQSQPSTLGEFFE